MPKINSRQLCYSCLMLFHDNKCNSQPSCSVLLVSCIVCMCRPAYVHGCRTGSIYLQYCMTSDLDCSQAQVVQKGLSFECKPNCQQALFEPNMLNMVNRPVLCNIFPAFCSTESIVSMTIVSCYGICQPASASTSKD